MNSTVDLPECRHTRVHVYTQLYDQPAPGIVAPGPPASGISLGLASYPVPYYRTTGGCSPCTRRTVLYSVLRYSYYAGTCSRTSGYSVVTSPHRLGSVRRSGSSLRARRAPQRLPPAARPGVAGGGTRRRLTLWRTGWGEPAAWRSPVPVGRRAGLADECSCCPTKRAQSARWRQVVRS